MTARLLVRAILAQTQAEIRLTIKRGESVLVTVIIPVTLLIFFASARFLPASERRIDSLLAATISLAVISTGLVSLGIATAYERYYGVLKRLGATPLPRWGLVAAKILSILVLEVGQCALLVGIAAAFYGWRPHGSVLLAALLLILGTAAFAGLGMAMAGSLRAEATLAGANALFLFFLLLGGLYVPLDRFPGLVSSLITILPSSALADAVRAALGGKSPTAASLAVLTAWAVCAPLVAARTFRWE